MALLSLPGAERLLREQVAELPQKDELCGPFWGLVTLRAAGVSQSPAGEQLDQDAVAALAGSRLSPPPRTRSRPPGEPGRDDYRLTLPIDEDDPGTSAAGVAHAVAELSGGRLAVVPVTGEWQAGRLLTLLRSLGDTPAFPVAVIANLDTGRLWPPTATASGYSRYLETGHHDEPRSDWSIGHFVALVGVEHGARGTLIHVADTYSSRGEHGRHRQPIERVAAALGADGRTRGLLVVVCAEAVTRVHGLVAAAGLQARGWDQVAAAGTDPGREAGHRPTDR